MRRPFDTTTLGDSDVTVALIENYVERESRTTQSTRDMPQRYGRSPVLYRWIPRRFGDPVQRLKLDYLRNLTRRGPGQSVPPHTSPGVTPVCHSRRFFGSYGRAWRLTVTSSAREALVYELFQAPFRRKARACCHPAGVSCRASPISGAQKAACNTPCR